MTGPWEIVETSEYATWFGSLTEKQQAAVMERVALLREKGPTLNRPVADAMFDRDLRGEEDRKSTRLNSSHVSESRMPSSA